MNVATKTKIKDWFIITRIRILNFIKEHKYVSAFIGVLLLSVVIALIVRAATNETKSDSTVDLSKVSIKLNNNEGNVSVDTYSEAIYTLNYYLSNPDCGDTEKVLYADTVTITAKLPQDIDKTGVSWVANEEAVSADVTNDNNGYVLTIKDHNVNVCSMQHQNISLRVLNSEKQVLTPEITISGGSNSSAQKIDENKIPKTNITYSEDIKLKAKLQPGIARSVNSTTRNATFGLLLGFESNTDVNNLKGKHLSTSADVYLLASQAADDGSSEEDLKILTDENTYGAYEHNKLKYFTASSVPDLGTYNTNTIKSFGKDNYVSSQTDVKTISSPKVTITNASNTSLKFEKYPISTSYTDDSLVGIDDKPIAKCNGSNCEIMYYKDDTPLSSGKIDLSEEGNYKIAYIVGNKNSSSTVTMYKKIEVISPKNYLYSLEGPLTQYVVKDTKEADFKEYGIYETSKAPKLLKDKYTVTYKKDNNEKQLKEVLSTPGTYKQIYKITQDNGQIKEIEREIKVTDTASSITSDVVSTETGVVSKDSKYEDNGIKINDEKKDCNSNNKCKYEPTTIDTTSKGTKEITYTVTGQNNEVITLKKPITVTPQYYKFSIENLVSSGTATRISGSNFYAVGSYYVTVPSVRSESDKRDFNVKLQAFQNDLGMVSETTVSSKVNSTGEATSTTSNSFYVNEDSSFVEVTNSKKSGLTGDYFTAAMGEEVEMKSKFEYAYDADNSIDKLNVTIPVNSNLLPIGYDSTTFSYYNLTATLDGVKIMASPKVTVSYCKTATNDDCFTPTPENYADSTTIINHINITIEKNTYANSEDNSEETFEIKPGTIIELSTKYKVRTISGTKDEAKDLSNIKFNGQVSFSWADASTKKVITKTPSATPDVYVTPYKARTIVGVGLKNKFSYDDITIDASKNNVYTVYASPDVISPAMNVQSNIFGYTRLSSMEVSFDLPEGVIYVYNKDYTNVPTITNNGRTLTYTITNIEPNSWIEPIYFDFSVDVTKAHSTLSDGKTGFILTTHTGNPSNMDKSITNDQSSIDYFRTTNSVIRIENTENVSYGQYIYSKGQNVTNIDMNDEFEISTKLHNNVATNISNLTVTTVLPYVDSEKGASFNGTYQLTSLPKNALCTSDSPGKITSSETVGLVDWSKPCSDFKTSDNTYSNITAYKTSYTSLAASSDIDIRSNIKTLNNKPDDSYTFKSYLTYTKPDGTESGYIDFRDITLDVVSKKITGVVWEDFDVDGIMDDDEKKLDNVILRLYDESGNQVGTETTPNEEGVYTFSALEEGNYYVTAEFNRDKYGVTGAPSEDVYDMSKLSVFKSFEITPEDDSTSSDEENSNDEESPNETSENDSSESTVAYGKTDIISINSETRVVRNINLGLSLRKKFKVKMNKYITRAEVTNALGVVTKHDYGNTKLAKLDVKNINNLKIKVIYTIELQNVKYYPGYVSLVTEQIPDGMSFNPEYAENKGWEMTDGGVVINRTLSDTLIYENDKKYLTIAFDITRKEAGSFINMASVDDLQILGGGKGE